MRTLFRVPLPLLALTLLGCPGSDEDTDPVVDTFEWPDCTDEDGDGRCAEDQDCDDSDPEIHEGRRETCNGVDDNCNGIIDEGMSDVDQDGTCDGIDSEECDGVDNDGDDLIDEDFADNDGDGIADCVDSEECDGIDNDGDGTIDEGYDADNDGATQCGDIDGNNADCDDANDEVYPGATEAADDFDNDCDGLVDEGAWAEGDLIITEIMANPSTVGDPTGEWFEVYNASGRDVYLNGLRLRDSNGQNHQVSPDGLLSVPAGGYAVLGIEARVDRNGRVPVDYQYSDMSLANTGDDLQLWIIDETGGEPDTVMLDAVAWDDSYPVVPGASMMLEPRYLNGIDNDDSLYWCPAYEQWELGTDLGSPGFDNPTCRTFDADGDGFSPDDGDCADDDADIFPGAPETDSGVDQDCDGVAERGPNASAVIDTEVSETATCGIVYLDGTGTTDPDGDTVETWEWTFDTLPSGSTLTDADIRNADRSFASFEPDIDGVYVVQLLARDSGGAAGAPATASVTIDARSDNEVPVADAGGNQVALDEAKCVDIGGGVYNCSSCVDMEFDLDGSRSRDLDGDSLSYLWTVTSGTGVLSERTSAETSVTVSGATPAPGGKGTSTVFIDLVVTDCMGASSTADTMAIVYTCEDEG